MPGPAGVPRADILPYIAAGFSDREIGRQLHTNPKRVARIRREYGLPPFDPAGTLTIGQKWATHARPVGDGHMEWVGPRGPYGTPLVCHGNKRHQARAVAFREQYGRKPVGQVRPTCGETWCVAPDHVADQPMRRADAAYNAIFGQVTA